jgi:hypothetical protein
MTAEITMGKIKPRHVHARFEQFLQRWDRFRRRANGADDFSFVFG